MNNVRCLLGAHRYKRCLRWLEPPTFSCPEEAIAAAIYMPGLASLVLDGHWKPQWINKGRKCVDCGKRAKS
jgi:hypothetical protein